jgi:hypothetical protein
VTEAIGSLDGAGYIAMVPLSDQDCNVLAEVGATCERVPASSLPWLIEQQLVVSTAAGEVTRGEVR